MEKVRNQLLNPICITPHTLYPYSLVGGSNPLFHPSRSSISYCVGCQNMIKSGKGQVSTSIERIKEWDPTRWLPLARGVSFISYVSTFYSFAFISSLPILVSSGLYFLCIYPCLILLCFSCLYLFLAKERQRRKTGKNGTKKLKEKKEIWKRRKNRNWERLVRRDKEG